MDGVKLTFDTGAYEYIVDKAIEFKLGARGLRSIVEAVMIDAMFNLPSEEKENKKLHVTRAYVKNQLENSDMHHLRVA
jgi:ATP-dependent Clp protease ATP-binding subunit ClpX